MKSFSVAGPCQPDEHHMLLPEPRLPEVRPLVAEGRYFVLHAPPQTGKTTLLASLARSLTTEGPFVALRVSCGTQEVADENYAAAQRALLGGIHRAAHVVELPSELMPPDP